MLNRGHLDMVAAPDAQVGKRFASTVALRRSTAEEAVRLPFLQFVTQRHTTLSRGDLRSVL